MEKSGDTEISRVDPDNGICAHRIIYHGVVRATGRYNGV